jgi:ferredoxin-NADP reductase
MTHAETIVVEVAAIEEVTPLIRAFTLRQPNGDDLPPFSGGSHVIVTMKGPSRTFRNPYSLLGSPRNLSCYRIAVRRDDQGRGGSLFMHEQIRPGSRLEISHPVNLFPLAKLARRQILIAGGVGITPVLAMIDDLEITQTPWELHYAFRGAEHTGFVGALQTAQSGCVHLYDTTQGARPEFSKILADRPLGTHVYTCGPRTMIDGVKQAALALGWAPSHIHHESFAAPAPGEPFDVFLVRSKLTVHVPAGQSLLEAIEAAGVDAPYLCRGGACGQCETDVLFADGELIHRDVWLSAEDRAGGKKIMPCVSRARGLRLELDR